MFRLFFFGTLQPKSDEFRSDIEKSFKKHIALCNENLHQILSSLPSLWQLDRPFIKEKIAFFFSDEWQTNSLNHFFDLFYHNYKRLKL
jgi:hypothetical protein